MNSNNLRNLSSLLMVASVSISFVLGMGFGIGVNKESELLLFVSVILIPVFAVISIAVSFKAGKKSQLENALIYTDPHADGRSQKATRE
jgi:hypothetical protein